MATGMATDRDGPPVRSRRLESWKEIAAYLGRDVRTVQRWERREGLPIHRLQHSRLGSVFANTAELDARREARDSAHHNVLSGRSRRGVRRAVWILVVGSVALTLVIARGSVLRRDAPVSGPVPIRSVAVLPLDDFSAEPRQGGTSVGLLPVAEARPKALAAATTALKLDPHLARAHAILARGHQQEWRWEEAEAAYRRAIQIDPNDSWAHGGFAGLLVFRGRTDEGLTLARRARDLDPLSMQRTVDLGWLLYHARRHEEAIREYRTVLAVEPDHRGALWFLGFALIDSSRLDEAIQTLEHLAVLRNRNPAELGLLARAYGRAGRRSDALRIVDELQRRARVTYVPPAPFVHAYVGLDDRDRAFVALERGYEERSNIVQLLRTHPLYDPLRSDPRFTDLLRRVRLDLRPVV